MVISYSCSVGTKLAWILSLLLILVAATQVHGVSPPGFLNIDCGLTNRSTYNDTNTTLTYVSDREFVESGKSYDIMAQYMADATNEQEKTLRSFPDGQRNCYTLPTNSTKKYLIRATFTYGNYDGLNSSEKGSLFLFGLHIGVNFWTTVNLTKWDPSNTVWKEVITVAPDKSVSVCLINMGSGTPFISTLDLRPLQDTMYPFVNASTSVSYFSRIRFGSVDEYITRFPTDQYDRFWEGWVFTMHTFPWVNKSSNGKVAELPNIDTFGLPPAILGSASTINGNYSWLNINVSASNSLATDLELLPVFHFVELGNNGSKRIFDIYNVDEPQALFSNFSPPSFLNSMFHNWFLRKGSRAYFQLRKTPDSQLPPLINAYEVYSRVQVENFTTASSDVDSMKTIKEKYMVIKNWNGDPCSPREYVWNGLTCTYPNGGQNPRIIEINLSGSGLQGELEISFMKMSSLKKLDLSHNDLTGTIPDYQVNSLTVIDLSNNQLNGSIPDSILQRYKAGLLELRLEGNPICSKVRASYCGNKKNTRTRILLISVLVPVTSLLVALFIFWRLCWKGKSRKSEEEDYDMYEEETPLHIDIRRFTYAELKLITNNFQSIIGKGGFGTVYHGILENNDEVAVKVLVETSIAESKDFLPEVQTLSKVHHKNLVALVGYCQNKKCLALVYDFMPRGNLQQLLRGGYDSLNWEERLHIALDAAQGLEYLHESCTPSIVHRDVKTPNILLDKNLVAKISDFGLSRAFNAAHTHISTVAAGTLGYLDPEYHATYQLTVKTDVYSFGIVLLEIVTGQPPVFMDPQTVHLPNWVRQKIANGSVHDVVDKKLLDQYDATHLQTVIDLAMNCLENASIDRPSMTEVVSVLKVCLPISSERQSATSTPRKKNVMDAEIPRQFQLMISGASTTSYEGSSFQSGYTGGVSEISHISGRKKYLIRATFTYGNYDGRNSSESGSPFLFELHIGINFWTMVNLTKLPSSDTVWKELIMVAPGNSVSVCLINKGSGTPFISTLDLRPLQDTMYPFVNVSVAVSYFSRLRFGQVNDVITRYPEDVYDRFWEGAFHTRSYPWIDLSTTQEVKRLPGDEKFMVPNTILQKASTINITFSWLNITVRGADNLLGSGDLELLPIFHFAEIASTTRLFDIYSDGEELFASFSPSPFQVDSMYQNGRFLRRVNSTFTLRKQPTSQLPPPLINAFEVYSLVRIATASDDGEQNSGLNSDIFVYTLYSRAKWIEPFVNCDLAGKSKEHDDYDMYEEDTPLHTDSRRFTYTELKTITNNFQSIIGKGGFGMVYHGILDNGEEVAVKVLRETSITLSKDFLPEVQMLSKVQHKNLVTFLGYCQNKKCLALVYNFMARGNLQEVLRGGLEYLHESCTPPIVHRDVKTANILLDKNLVAMISDFGLSRSYTPAHTHISTVAAGTGEMQLVSRSYKQKEAMDADIVRQFQLPISGVSIESIEGNSSGTTELRYPSGRYPTDDFDRFWESAQRYSFPWLNMSTNQKVDRLPGTDYFQVPTAIFQKASTIRSNYSLFNISVKFIINIDIDYRSLELLPVFHFAEIGDNNPNRTFDIYNDGNLLFSNYRPPPFQVNNMYSGQFLRKKGVNFTLHKAPSSELPPLINAFEMYSLVRMDNFTTSSDDVNYMKEVKKYYGSKRNWNGDPCSPIEYSWQGLMCDYFNGNQNPRVIRVDLSNNQLNGPIPGSILQRFQAGQLELRLQGNPICSEVKDRYCTYKKNTHILLITVIVPVVFLLLSVVLCILWKLCWKGKSEEQEDYSMYEEETPLHIDIRRFSYAELKLITKNFQSIIGKGGFGTVYHGILDNGEEVAVKVLLETSIALSKDFLAEVQTLSKVHHKNLVAFLGYCKNMKCLALVYDFMPRGNLQEVLRGGLEYLHESCTPAIVHRDVKTANILLDENLVAMISDFGLSRSYTPSHTHISTIAAGTVGYLGPEYHATFQLTVKADVYSFGIVLLEIITGQPSVLVDPEPVHLPNWVCQKIARGSIHDAVDSRLMHQYDATSVQSTGEKQLVSGSYKQKGAMDADIATQFQLLISGVPTNQCTYQTGCAKRLLKGAFMML
uniref:non-specific serine/threonine protein kinase n=1 Tax=Oryza meridionalis TaxID=40149 RepID=A0A0E0C9A7_9ORYZ